MSDPSMTTHLFYMREALEDARNALDQKEFPVGCVMVYQNRIIARGRRMHSHGKGLLELDHAEIVALRNIDSANAPVRMDQVIVYSTMEPCLMCYSTLLLNGIRHIVYAYEDAMGGGTSLPLQMLSPLYREMSVTIEAGICRPDSLSLMKTFFSDSGNDYWKDSLLAHYTLEQP